MMFGNTTLRMRFPRITRLSFLLTLLVLAIVVDFAPIFPEKPFRSTEFNNVVTMIKSGTLKPDLHGVVVLPGNLAFLTPTGHAYVSKDTKGAMIVFFPSWIGRRTLNENSWLADREFWLQGYIYDSGRPNLTHRLDDYDCWRVNAPAATTKWNSKTDGAIGESDLYADHQVQSHWYYAVTVVSR